MMPVKGVAPHRRRSCSCLAIIVAWLSSIKNEYRKKPLVRLVRVTL